MDTRIPHTSVWCRVFRAILSVTCICLFPTSTTAQAKITTTPVIAITGGNAETGYLQNQAQPEAIYLPLILAAATPVTDTGRGNGSVYYAALNGNDSNPGTAARPWKTLSRGVSALQAGDTLYIRGGTYRLSEPLTVTASGSASKGQITISTAPGEASLAVITGDTNGDGTADAPAGNKNAALIELHGSSLHLENLFVEKSLGRGIRSRGTNNVISYNNVHHTWGNGIYVTGPDNVVEKNSVWRTADSNYCNGAQGRRCNGTWPGGIAWGATDSSSAPGAAPRIIIRENTVYNNSGEGLLCMHTDNGLVEGNIIYDNWAAGVDLDQCSYTMLQNNLIYATLDSTWWRYSQRPSTGILLSNEGIPDANGRIYPIGHDRKVINNIVVGAGVAISFWAGDYTGGRLPGSALVNDLIANNTLANTQSPGSMGITIGYGPHANTRFINNIIFETKNEVAWAEESTAGITFAHNLWSKAPPVEMSSSTDVIGDPRLAEPNHAITAGKVQAEWYRLIGASPAINQGMALADVTQDFWGSERPARQIDIGADEY